MLTVSPSTVDGYKRLFGDIVAEREAAYFSTYQVMADEVNDPQGLQDLKMRKIMSAHGDGFSLHTSKLSFVATLTQLIQGTISQTSNPFFGIVQTYRQSISRAAHGLPKNMSDRKSGRKRKKRAKKINKWERIWLET